MTKKNNGCRTWPGLAQRVLPERANVGCDAGGQETRCHLSEDGQYYILNGEKKWATSGALSGLFTVMAKQKITDRRPQGNGQGHGAGVYARHARDRYFPKEPE